MGSFRGRRATAEASADAPMTSALPAALPFVHVDTRLAVVDKPAGLLVHRSALDAHEQDSALDRLRAATGERWWPAHRLDKGTSGLLVFARDADAARSLGQAFEDGDVAKTYLALVRGWPEAAGEIDHPLARDPERPSTGQPTRPALTRYRRIECFEWPFSVDGRHPAARYALVEVRPLSGRRHQIRRHFKHIGHPLVGDATHGKGPHNRAVAAYLGLQRLWLHAVAIDLPHPDDNRRLLLRAEPGAEWAALRTPPAPA